MNLLKVEGIVKRFGGLCAVDTLSFDVKPQEILSLIGPNGAGKTTTFNMLTHFIPPDSGKIYYKDIDITQYPPHQIATLGIVRTFQHTNIFPQATVEDNVKMGCFKLTSSGMLDIILHTKRFRTEEKMVKEKTLEILEFLNMQEVKDLQAKNLSYGQKRILEIAIAMACEPKLLLLDEPVAGLNPSESRGVMHIISKIREQGTTVLLVEHDMSVVMNISDRIVVLNFGKKIAEGTPAEVGCNPEVIRAYLGGVGVA